MNYEGLPEPAIELLFWYLPVDICLIRVLQCFALHLLFLYNLNNITWSSKFFAG